LCAAPAAAASATAPAGFDEFGSNAACGTVAVTVSKLEAPKKLLPVYSWELAGKAGLTKASFSFPYRVRFLGLADEEAVLAYIAANSGWRDVSIMDGVAFWLVQVLQAAGAPAPVDQHGEPLQPTLGCLQLVGCAEPRQGDVADILSHRQHSPLWAPGDRPSTYILCTINKITANVVVKDLAQATADLASACTANGWDPNTSYLGNNTVIFVSDTMNFEVASCRTSNKKDPKKDSNNNNGGFTNRGSTGGDGKILDKETTYWLQLQQVPDDNGRVVQLPGMYQQQYTCAFSASQVPRVAGQFGGVPRDYPKPQQLVGRFIKMSRFAVVAQRTDYKASGRELVLKHYARLAVPEWLAEDGGAQRRSRSSF